MAAPSEPKPSEGVKPPASADLIDALEVDTASESWLTLDAWIEADLERLEDCFGDFQTHSSLRNSLGR